MRKTRKQKSVATINWWCRICWYRGKTDVDYNEIQGFTIEGIRIKIEGLHRTVCENGEVRLSGSPK